MSKNLEAVFRAAAVASAGLLFASVAVGQSAATAPRAAMPDAARTTLPYPVIVVNVKTRTIILGNSNCDGPGPGLPGRRPPKKRDPTEKCVPETPVEMTPQAREKLNQQAEALLAAANKHPVTIRIVCLCKST